MKQLIAQVIDIPGYGSVTGHEKLDPKFNDFASLVNNFIDLFFMLAIFLAFIWMVWGAFQYIFAGGDKTALGNARKRIIWAVVGLIITAISFLIAQAIEEIVQPRIKSPISLVNTVYAAGVDIGDHYGFGWYQSLGGLIQQLTNPAFAIAGVAVVFYVILGAFKYITSAGNKDTTKSARDMITHGIIGFILLLLIFLIMEIIPEIIGVNFSIIQR